VALCEMLQGLGLGDEDGLELKMKNYHQTDEKTGIITTLEEYIKTKRYWLAQWQSAAGMKLSQADQIKWINKSLSPKLFATQMEIYSDKEQRKSVTLIAYLTKLQNANAIRLQNGDDVQMILDSRGFATPLTKSKGYQQRAEIKRVPVIKAGMNCYNCGKPGHFSKDCPLPKARKGCYECGKEGHVRRDCPEKKPKEEPARAQPGRAQGKFIWGGSLMARKPAPSLETVAIDSGSSWSAFNSKEY